MSVPIPPSVQQHLQEVCSFFGIDLDANRHIFAHAAKDNLGAFGQVIGLLSGAIQQDKRYGTGRRIREQISLERDQRNAKGSGYVGRRG